MKVTLELCCWKLCSVGKVYQKHLMKTELSFSEVFEMPTFQNHEKYALCLPRNKLITELLRC